MVFLKFLVLNFEYSTNFESISQEKDFLTFFINPQSLVNNCGTIISASPDIISQKVFNRLLWPFDNKGFTFIWITKSNYKVKNTISNCDDNFRKTTEPTKKQKLLKT